MKAVWEVEEGVNRWSDRVDNTKLIVEGLSDTNYSGVRSGSNNTEGVDNSSLVVVFGMTSPDVVLSFLRVKHIEDVLSTDIPALMTDLYSNRVGTCNDAGSWNDTPDSVESGKGRQVKCLVGVMSVPVADSNIERQPCVTAREGVNHFPSVASRQCKHD